MDAAALLMAELSRAGRSVLTEDDAGWDVALETAILLAREAWPDLPDQTDAFVRHLAGKLAPDASLPDAITGLHTSDLWIVVACLSGDDTAREQFDRTFLPVARSAWRRMGLGAPTVEDLEQSLRMSFHLAPEQQSALLGYSGRGALRAWVKSTAVHAALKNIRTDDRRRARDGTQLQHGVLAVDPEIEYLRQRYARELSAAFEAAVSELSARERTLLRQHFVDGLTCDDLALVHGIHRSTAARRVDRARSRLAEVIKDRLRNELRISQVELESMIRLVRSELHLSLHRIFGPGS